MIVPANLSETTARINAWFDKVPSDLYSWHELRKERVKEYLALFSHYHVETRYVILITSMFLRKEIPPGCITITNNRHGFILVTIAESVIDAQALHANVPVYSECVDNCADNISFFSIPFGVYAANKPQPECGLLIPTEPITKEVKEYNDAIIKWYSRGMTEIDDNASMQKATVTSAMKQNLYYILEKLLGV